MTTSKHVPERHRITCLVDNLAASSTRLWGEHGSAWLLESEQHRILFDTGQSGDVIVHNLSVLGLSLDGLRAIVLSHGHYDHVGGLDAVLSLTGAVEIIGHPDLFSERFSRSAGGDLKPVGFTPPWPETAHPARWRLEAGPVEVAPGVWTTGEVPRSVDPGHPDPRLVIRHEQGWAPDPLLDDQSLVLSSEQGLTLLLGCCHAGLLNTLDHVEGTFGRPVRAVIGGTHLGRADEQTLDRVIRSLEERHAIEEYWLGHCTGSRALLAFDRAFGARVQWCQAGLQLQV